MRLTLATMLFLVSPAAALATDYGSLSSCDAYSHPTEGLSGEDMVYSGEKIADQELNLLVTPTAIIGYEWSCERVVPDATGDVELLCSGDGLDMNSNAAKISVSNNTLTFAWRGRSFMLQRCELSQVISKPPPPPKASGNCQ